MKTRPRSRAKGAEDNSPGQHPGYIAEEIFSALKGRRDPAPFHGGKRSFDALTQGVALGYHPPRLWRDFEAVVSRGVSCQQAFMK